MSDKILKEQKCLTSTTNEEGKDDSKVARFYQGRVIFITGGTGFIGKVLLEKLLRSCPGLKRVYLLVRSKRGENPQARLQKMLDSKMFEHLKQEHPDALKKVTALAGDLTEPNLGLSASDQATLVDSVSVVFHSGATVRFDEPLREAVRLNVLGTRRVLDLCKKMPNLSAFVHVPKNSLNLLSFQVKSVAESLLLEERGDIPAVIVRPSIVTASNREPLPGWVDNYNGCTGILVVLGLGMLQSVLAEKEFVGDIVPVDVVANMLICVAWHTAETRPKDLEVYHCTSGALAGRTWAYLTGGIQREFRRHPLPNAVRFPKFHLTNSQLWHSVNLWCLHYLPALVVDLALQLHGQKPRFVRHYHKICKAINALKYFLTHEWLFRSNNALRLLQELSPTDAQLFDFDVRRLEWRSYFKSYVLGIRKYLLKAEDSELPEARKRIKRLNAVRWSLYLGLAAIPWGLACKGDDLGHVLVSAWLCH
ncbi:hypothetical protein MTO96_000860 [Rhipicephalus appendiculatus]